MANHASRCNMPLESTRGVHRIGRIILVKYCDYPLTPPEAQRATLTLIGASMTLYAYMLPNSHISDIAMVVSSRLPNVHSQ